MDALLGHQIAGNWAHTMQKPDLFGLEIELEGKKIISQDMGIASYWTQHKDGSLRAKEPGDECIEYVFKHPMTMDETIVGLAQLYKHLKSPGVKVYDSYRTSIHVHVNCMAETFRTIVNYITLAIIFDELLVSQNGQGRIGNNFTLRTRDAEGQLNDLIYSIQNYANPYAGINANHRYSSVNIASLGKFGTIEFRSLECTTDVDRVIHWIKTCQALKVAARNYRNPRDIIDTFSRKGSLGFILFNLGDQASKYLNVPDYNEMLHVGMRLAQDFAFCSEWIPPDKADLKEAEAQLKKMRKSPQKLGDWANVNQINNYINGLGAAPPAYQPAVPMYWDEGANLVGGPEVHPAYVPDEPDFDDHIPDFIEDDDD